MTTLQPGQMLGSYRIISQIGQGGMATVYKAYQASMDRNVAVKVLPGQLAESPEFATRFQQEARIIARLEHPHILPVFDYGEDNGITYFVMRYLDAGSLKDKMALGPLTLAEIDRVFTQLADALGYAHARGIVHRDLKPANALIDSDSNLFLTDFGIAKLLESASPRLTQTDAIMGTPAYISPEQAQAQPVDRRSDIYSLGIILYEMVTGQVPFVADTPLAVLFKHISDPLPPPSRVKPDIHPSIEQVLLKALAKTPQDRYATAAEFAAAWKRAFNAQNTLVPESTPASAARVKPPGETQRPPVSVTRAASRPRRSTPWIVGCLAGACLLFSVAGVAVLGANWKNLAFLNPATATPAAPPTVIASLVPPTDVPPPAATVEVSNPGSILLEDDFSARSSNWGTLNGAESSIEYLADALQVRVFKENFVVWTTPNDQEYDNIHLEVTVRTNDSDPTTAFGLMCAQQVEEWSFYYLVITPAGEYTVAKAVTGETDVFLT